MLRDDVIGVVSDSESEVYDDDDNNDKSPKLSDTSCHDEILEKLEEKPKKSEEIDDDEGRLEEVLKEQDLPPPRRGGRRRGRGSSCSSTDSEKTDFEVDAKESRSDETMTTIQHLLLSHSGALSTTGRSGPMRSGAKAPPTAAAVDGEGERDRSRNRLEQFGGRLLLMDERFMPTPPPSASPLIRGPDRPMSSANGHHWTFEEQFKQVTTPSFDLTVDGHTGDLDLFKVIAITLHLEETTKMNCSDFLRCLPQARVRSI